MNVNTQLELLGKIVKAQNAEDQAYRKFKNCTVDLSLYVDWINAQKYARELDELYQELMDE
jgi:hypothetical protein